MSPTAYEKQITKLREDDIQNSINDPLDWLNLAGLFWLEEGDNFFGSDEGHKISMPKFPAATCGNFHLKNGEVIFHPAKGVNYTANNPHPETRPLITDRDKKPDLITFGALTLKIIVRGPSTLVRVWDRDSSAKKEFKSYKYFPINTEYIVKAKYVRYDPPKLIKRTDMIGTETEGLLLGQAQFSFQGMDCTLEAEKDGDGLLFHFTDATSKITTYGGGRKFTIPSPDSDEIILDFNLSENWPCAYTPYATCPLVLNENRLSIKLEAGEKNYFDK